MTICARCGGTRLPYSRSGADRGSCHCPRGPGSIRTRFFYSTEEAPAYHLCDVHFPGMPIITFDTLDEAVEHLEWLRAQFKEDPV